MKKIEEVVVALNARLAGTSLGDFYERRFRLNGGRRRAGGLFQVTHGNELPLSGYSFHRGGRSELQFNIGFEEGGHFRYGVAFSLESNRNLTDPVSVLRPKILRFNAALPEFPVLQNLRMWAYRKKVRSADTNVEVVPDEWIRPSTFVFVGERVQVTPRGVTPEMVERAASVLVSLLPVYERVEGAEEGRTVAVARPERAAVIPEYIARLAYNSARWRRPTHAGEVHESGDTYRSEQGFGHEDWLFRNEWLLDGWRYGFVQGVNKSRKKLLAEGRPFHLRLFTMPAPGDRRAVAEIREVECLTDAMAADAVAAFEEMGWLDAMRAEVKAAGGRVEALGQTEYAPFILNLRYRVDNLHWLDAEVPLPADDPIHNIKRYSLCEVGGAMDSAGPAWRGRTGSADVPSAGERRRFVQGGWTTYSPEHSRMQNALVAQLRERYPGAKVECERDFVDVMVRTDEEILLFEVKSDLHPLSVVRQALGQVLEYAFHPRRTHDLPLQLVLVGRRALEGDDLAYFEQLRQRFALPLSYWTVPI
ncbi:hypothetical protein [Lysobacter fragariae]